MPYGMEVQTTAGMISTLNMRAARLFFSQDVSGTSGNFVVPGFDMDKGHIVGVPIGNIIDPVFAFDNSTKTLFWARGVSSATSFRFFFYLFR